MGDLLTLILNSFIKFGKNENHIRMRYTFILIAIAFLSCGFRSDVKQVSQNEHLTLAVLFQQQSPEYIALCHQAYNSAKMKLVEYATDKSKKPGEMAIILDLDETVLDNSPYEAKCILDNISYPVGWDDWCNKASAKAVPGSLEFLYLADSLGFRIFYISNRKDKFRKVTKENMITLKAPQVDDSNILLRTDDRSKEGRRTSVSEKYEVIMLIGDNLDDFHKTFEDTHGDDRKKAAEEMKAMMGDQFIVLPNPMYGHWEMDLYSNQKTDGLDAKRQARYDGLTGF